MLGGLVTPADSENTSLGMGLSIASKLELEGECLGGYGVVVTQWSQHWQLKPEALGLFPAAARMFSLPASFLM